MFSLHPIAFARRRRPSCLYKIRIALEIRAAKTLEMRAGLPGIPPGSWGRRVPLEFRWATSLRPRNRRNPSLIPPGFVAGRGARLWRPGLRHGGASQRYPPRDIFGMRRRSKPTPAEGPQGARRQFPKAARLYEWTKLVRRIHRGRGLQKQDMRLGITAAASESSCLTRGGLRRRKFGARGMQI